MSEHPAVTLGDRPGAVVIKPSTGWTFPRLGELLEYRELLYFLAWRDVKVRYKQTALGAVWAVLQPVLFVLVFTVVFSRLVRVGSEGIPYPLFAFAGLLPWLFFSKAVQRASGSLVANEPLVTKVYFPRLLIPLAAGFGGLVDFAIGSLVLIVLLIGYGIVPSATVLVLPLVALLALATALAFGIALSALNVKYRDVQNALPLLVQIGLFATPVAYPRSLVPEEWRPLYDLNPMVGVVEGFRWALFGTGSDIGALVLVSLSIVTVLLVAGLAYFRRAETAFADLV